LKAGIRADPPMSVPRPKGLPQADTILACYENKLFNKWHSFAL